jgi:ATP-binding cassette, subfamily B, multidrug efflux pump
LNLNCRAYSLLSIFVSFVKHLRHLNKYFVKYKWRFLLGVLFVALSNVFRALQPSVVRNALDRVWVNLKAYNTAGDAERERLYDVLGGELLQLAGILLLLALLMGIFMYFMRQTIIVMSRLIEYDLRKEIFAQYERLDLTFYRQNKTGDMMARITEDVTKVRMYLGPAVLYGINLATLFVMVIYMMFSVNVELTLYTLLPLPVLSLSIYYVSNIIHKKSALIQAQLSQLNSIAQEVYSGIRVIKSYVQGRQFGKYFEDQSHDYKTKNLSLAQVNALFFPLMLVLIGTSTILVIYVGGIQVSRGEITPGNIAEFVIYVNMLTWPVTAIGWIASIVQQAEASQKRINEFLHAEPLVEHQAGGITDDLDGSIEFRDVTFTYPDTGITAIRDLNLKIAPGERIAIIGRTASGKTTIADLLLRMYDVSKGEILFNGVNIQEHNLSNLRQRIGYIPQDMFLFSDTIANNILFGSQSEDEEKAREYAEYAAVSKDIEELPNAYKTMVGERGVTLSGGQKQRISIARAFVKEPDILILDDCLSAVDTKTEQEIVRYLNVALKGKTSITITHRILGAMEFDKIIVLEQGKIAEIGTHRALLDKRGIYHQILTRQTLEDQYAL